MKIVKPGRMVIEDGKIFVEGFEFSCLGESQRDTRGVPELLADWARETIQHFFLTTNGVVQIGVKADAVDNGIVPEED